MTDEPLYIDDIVPQRLVVELGRNNAVALQQMVEDRVDTNKSTIVNQALQLLLLIQRIETTGGKIYVQEAGETDAQRARFFTEADRG